MSPLDKTRERLRPLLLFTFCLAQLLDALNLAGANVALPKIQAELGFTDANLQWVISAYALTFGGFLLLTGRLGDVYGHRKFFILGLLWFAVFAVVTGFSNSVTMMIISRGLQGIGAASTIPNSVALILRNFKAGREQNQAMSLFASSGAIGFVVGIIIGGAVTQSVLGWRWIFFLSAIIAGLMAVVSVLVIPKAAKEDGEVEKKTIDVLGAVLSTSSVLLFVYVLTDGNATGWSNPRIISLLIVSVILMVAFILVESRIKQPLMPLSIWRLPNFAPAFVIACCLVGFFQGYLYFITLIYQNIFFYSPLESAIHYLPLGIIAGIMGIASERIIFRFNIKVALVAGLSLGTIGVVIVGFYYREDQYWSIAFPSFLVGVTGLATVYASSSIAAIQSAPNDQAGIVGGLLNTAFQVGGGLGLAILTAINTSVNNGGTSPDEKLNGYHAGLWGSLGLIVLALIVAILFIRANVGKESDEKKKDEKETQISAQKRMEEGIPVGRDEEDITIIGEDDITNGLK